MISSNANKVRSSLVFPTNSGKRKVNLAELGAESRPVAKHHPITRQSFAKQGRSEGVLLPALNPFEASKSSEGFEQWALETYEWLGLVSLQSPRVLQSDSLDSYLSRYKVRGDDSGPNAKVLIGIEWTGFFPVTWVRNLIVELKYATAASLEAVPSHSS